jgi:hypothetical protein
MSDDTPSVEPVETAPPEAPVVSQSEPEAPPAPESATAEPSVQAEEQSVTADEKSPAQVEHESKQEVQAHYDAIDTLEAALDAAPGVTDSFQTGVLHSDTVIVNAGRGDKSQIQLHKNTAR